MKQLEGRKGLSAAGAEAELGPHLSLDLLQRFSFQRMNAGAC